MGYTDAMRRSPASHKGENGTVAVLGGSHRYHGAPIFAALGALGSGVDLVYPVVHSCNETVTKAASPAFIVRTFKDASLTDKEVRGVLALLQEVHVAVLGPGMAETKENEAALAFLVGHAPCALVLDARALRPRIVRAIKPGTTAVLTPHLGELEHLTGRSLSEIPRREIHALVKLLAAETGATVVLKGQSDYLCDARGKTATVKGGNAGLTKGGTGDLLAGLIAGLLAQGLAPMDACALGCAVMKKAGEELYPTLGFAYGTLDVAARIPAVLHALSDRA